MAAIAPDTEKLVDVDEHTRRAWSTYSESLRDLAGEEYERTEHASWDELQSELRRLERKQQSAAPAVE